MPGLGSSFGRGTATNFLQDLQNSDCIFIIGSNFAKSHPVGFRWVMTAKERGATMVLAVEMLGKQHGKYGGIAEEPASTRLVSEEQLKELEAIALDKLRCTARHGSLLTSLHCQCCSNAIETGLEKQK